MTIHLGRGRRGHWRQQDTFGNHERTVQFGRCDSLRYEREFRAIAAKPDGRRSAQFSFNDALSVKEGSIRTAGVTNPPDTFLAPDLYVLCRNRGRIRSVNDQIAFLAPSDARRAIAKEVSGARQWTRVGNQPRSGSRNCYSFVSHSSQ